VPNTRQSGVKVLFNIFDTETTGLPNHPESELSGQPRIIEFGGIVTDGVSILDELEFKCDPGVPLEAVITKITGLKDEDLKGQPAFRTRFDDLRQYFGAARGRVAHNLAFDRDMLLFECERAERTLTDIGYYTDSPGGSLTIELCTVEQSFFEYGKYMKLQELIEIVKGQYVQKHRALDDVLQLFDVAKYLKIFEVFS
jgi:DNA polymerase III epsilon subunit-like protein